MGASPKKRGQLAGSATADAMAPLGKRVGASESTMRLLNYAVEQGSAWSSAEAARALELNPSTCFNLVQTLVAGGYLAAAGMNKRYTVGPSLRQLAQRLFAQSLDLSSVRPLMQAVADRWKVTITLWHRRSAARMELVAVATCNTAVNIQMPIGQTLPILVGGMGRIMALQGGLTEQQRQAAFDEVVWQRPLVLATLMTQARQAKRLGWGLDDGYMHLSVTALAVPVPRAVAGEPVEYVCSATMFRRQHDRATLPSIAEDLRPVAAGLATVAKS
jgi:DNA-binding IclR family transcriptional regulator